MNEGMVFNMVGGTSAPKVKPSALAVTTPPAKTEYLSGEVFSPAGMVVTVTYTDGAFGAVEDYLVSPLALTDGVTYVTVSYTAGGVTVKAYQEVTVIHRLVSLSVTKKPERSTYEIGDTVELAGGVFTASYSDGAEKDVSADVSPYPSVLTSLSENSVSVRYTERGVTALASFPVTVERKTIEAIPDQSGTLTYTGSVLAPEWKGYDANVMTLGGVVNATNAGSYTATFTPKEGCRWADGSTTAKSAVWMIGKASGSVTLSPASLALSADAMTGEITVTRAGNGGISALSDNTAAATVSLSGNKVTVSAVANGSANVTVSVAEGTNHKAASAVCSVEVKLSAYDPVFANNTWEDIIAACQAGEVPDTWVPGDSKEMTIGGAVHPVMIIGKNHDDYADKSGKAPLTLMTKHCVRKNKYGWTGTDGEYMYTASDSWESSYLRNEVLNDTYGIGGTIIDDLPSLVSGSVRKVLKQTAKAYDLSKISTTEDQLFLLSEVEVFGSNANSTPGEGTVYEYFLANGGEGRKKTYNGSASSWWTRSPETRGSHVTEVGFSGLYLWYVLVNVYGNVSTETVDTDAGIPIAFCF